MSKKLLTIFVMGLVIISVLAIPLNLSALMGNGCKAYCGGGTFCCSCGPGPSYGCVSGTHLAGCCCWEGAAWTYCYC